METLGLGNKIAELKHQIMLANNELATIEIPIKSSPELIESTNLLRENEYLTKVNSKQIQLLDLYEKYGNELEETFSLVFEIQNELKDLIKDHAKEITRTKKQNRPTNKKLKAKKTRKKSKTKRTKSKKRK